MTSDSPAAPPAARPLTLVHTEASCGWGGQDMRVLREAEWFRARGHTVHLVLNPAGELFRRATAAGFAPVPMALTKRSQVGDLFRLIALFRRVRPDVVATHSSVDSRVALIAAALTGVACRLRYRHVSTPVKSGVFARWQYGRLATHVITTGDTICRHLIETLGLPASRVTCVSSGVEAPADLPGRVDARRALANELALPDDTRFIGQVSVMRSWKGHADLLQAFDAIADEYPRLHLALVGGGNYGDDVRAIADRIRHRDRVHFLGHRENPWPCFRALDVCTLCSVSGEGIPQALMQAMLAETPVIGTSVGGIPEVVLHEQTGLIVPPASPEALAQAIRLTLSDTAATAARVAEGRRKMLAERSPDAMGAAVSEIIRRHAR